MGSVLNVLSYIWPFLLLITPVIFFHELGHFSVARFFRVKVETFSIGFGREIVGWTDRSGTRWKISWLPFGGYVKFWGDADAASTPDREKLEAASAADRAGSLFHKPVWQRMLITAAGPAANFILALVILSTLNLIYGTILEPVIVSKVVPGAPAAAAGVKPGDTIRAIDGTPIRNFDDMIHIVSLNTGETLAITVDRQGKSLILHAEPQLLDAKDGMGRRAMLGIQHAADPKHPPVRVPLGPIQAVGQAFSDVGFICHSVWNFRVQLFAGKADASQLTGPVGMVKISHDVAQIGLVALIGLAALISVSIGLVNLFPIPMLDGGHLLYYAVEAVLGRPMSARAQDIGFRLGLMFVLGLMLFVTWNDLVHHLNLF
jgi:regulator of sigma E protease